jgi:hypothetical protein
MAAAIRQHMGNSRLDEQSAKELVALLHAGHALFPLMDDGAIFEGILMLTEWFKKTLNELAGIRARGITGTVGEDREEEMRRQVTMQARAEVLQNSLREIMDLLQPWLRRLVLPKRMRRQAKALLSFPGGVVG